MPDVTHTSRHRADALRVAFDRGGWLVVLAFMVAGLVFSAPASAHDVSKGAAHAKCRKYVRGVVHDPRSAYTMAYFKTVRAFPDHNHYIRCTVTYDTKKTQSTRLYACRETLDVYLLPEDFDRHATLFMRHITPACGRETLTGPQPR